MHVAVPRSSVAQGDPCPADPCCCRQQLEAAAERCLEEQLRSTLAALGPDLQLSLGLGLEALPLGGDTSSVGASWAAAPALSGLESGFAVAELLERDMEAGDDEEPAALPPPPRAPLPQLGELALRVACCI